VTPFPAHRARVVVVCASVEATSTSKTGNSNKFHSWERLANGNYKHTYGRVGTPGQSHEVTEAKARAKWADAMKGGYIEADILDGTTGTASAKNPAGAAAREIAVKQIAKGNKDLEALVTMLADKNVHQLTAATTLKYDVATGLFSTPLGVVSRDTIAKARTQLTFAQAAVGKIKDDKLATAFLMQIPQDIGRDRPTFDRVFGEKGEKIADLYAITNALEGSLDLIERGANKKPDAPTNELSIFDITMEPCDAMELRRVDAFFRSSVNRVHAAAQAGLKPKRAWKVALAAMEARFRKDDPNRKELWHGTRVGNVLSILSKGLIIPPSGAAHCTGRMFGDGLYFSDQSSKSLNYAYGYWDGGAKDNTCFMFMADVALGKAYTPPGPCRSIPAGYDSCFAVGGKSGVANNEIIVYTLDRARLTHLVEFAA